MKLFVFLGIGICSVIADDHASWGYTGNSGPENWAHISMGGTNQCGMQRQSPIDIEALTTRYDHSMRPIKITGHDKLISEASIVNNGHSVQISSPSWAQRLSGGPLTGDYKLLQMHFHWGKDSYRGSEHTINGRRYPIELHLVHVQSNITNGKTDYPGAITVLGVFFDVTRGPSNLGIQKITRAIKELNNGTTAKVKELSTDMLIPNTKNFFTYEGSLTTPPCSQVVTWLVLVEPLKITEEDLEVFRSLLFSDKTPMVDNFRPIQPLFARQVRASFSLSSAQSLVPFGSTILVALLACLVLRSD